MGIYVEIPIRASMDELWEKTQNPQLHERWDLRFSSIQYFPRLDDEPQKFLYRTRIGFGLSIAGEGESVGTRDGEDGSRTSSLKFWSDDPKSLIRVGSGYWKYLPDGDAIRFLTWYDYETRFGLLGKFADAWVFRPLLGWATAWSFDALRLWIEKGIPPAASRDRALVYSVSRGILAFIWFYHGLVPKLLFHDKIELDLLSRVVHSPPLVWRLTNLAGVVEIFFAFVLLGWRRKWPLWVTFFLMLAGIPIVALSAPSYLTAAFNPLTLNLSVAGFALIAILSARDLPSASRCRRKPPEGRA
jgi:DoxX-like protein